MTRAASMLFLAVVVAQVIGLITFAAVRQTAVTQGLEITLQTAPVDPRSLFQGDYAIVDYEIGELPARLRQQPAGAEVFVTLEQCGEVWCAADYTLAQPQSGEVYIRGVVSSRGRLDFGIGTYFVPEGMGDHIEWAQDVKVVISLGDQGRAVIKEVLVDGLSFQGGGA